MGGEISSGVLLDRPLNLVDGKACGLALEGPLPDTLLAEEAEALVFLDIFFNFASLSNIFCLFLCNFLKRSFFWSSDSTAAAFIPALRHLSWRHFLQFRRVVALMKQSELLNPLALLRHTNFGETVVFW